MVERARSPSLQTCAVECGSRCCVGDGYVEMSVGELAAARRHSKRAADLHPMEFGSRWALMFAEYEMRCPFLLAENRCEIYDVRPDACRRFPERPMTGCLVLPVLRVCG